MGWKPGLLLLLQQVRPAGAPPDGLHGLDVLCWTVAPDANRCGLCGHSRTVLAKYSFLLRATFSSQIALCVRKSNGKERFRMDVNTALPQITKVKLAILFRGAAALVMASALVGFSATVSTNSGSSQSPAAARSNARPNIIFILADDLGYGDLGCYGQTRIKTPALDRMAAEGIRFTQAYAGSTVCAPSRCSLMTGLHTGHAYVRGNAQLPLRPEDLTLAEVLRKAGYRTALIGKWGLGEFSTTGAPDAQGFDEYVGYLNQTHAHDYYPTHLFRCEPRTGFNRQLDLPENYEDKKALYSHDLFTTAALNYLRINKPDFVSPKPFFLYLSYTIPHANNEETRRSGNGMQVPSDAPYSGESWPQPEKNKAAMITRMDADIGRLIEKLKELGIDDNTLILFSSDNGAHKEGGNNPVFFQSSGPFRGIKRDLYEGGIRVPMLARWPGKVPAGKVNDEVWAFWDVLPTLAEIAEADAPKDIDGISVAPALLGRAQTNHHEFLYWEFHEKGFQQAARRGDWKAVRTASGEVELYNLKADIGEKTNLAASEPKLLKELEAIMKSARTDSEHFKIKPPAPARVPSN